MRAWPWSKGQSRGEERDREDWEKAFNSLWMLSDKNGSWKLPRDRQENLIPASWKQLNVSIYPHKKENWAWEWNMLRLQHWWKRVKYTYNKPTVYLCCVLPRISWRCLQTLRCSCSSPPVKTCCGHTLRCRCQTHQSPHDETGSHPPLSGSPPFRVKIIKGYIHCLQTQMYDPMETLRLLDKVHL